MSSYRIEVRPAASRSLRKLDPHIAGRIRGAIAMLAQDPRPPGSRPLRERPGRLRIRIGDYRVIYMIEDDVLLVIVLAVGHRREIYR